MAKFWQKNTYAIQHPGEPNRQSIQSVNVHLISLYLILVKEYDVETATKKMGEILSKEPKFEWLEPPSPIRHITVADVLTTSNQEEHEKKVREWAENVWNDWYSKHAQTIKALVNDNL